MSNPKTRPYLKDKFYTINKLKAIIIHGTNNQHPTADAAFHLRYFDLGIRKASAHYVVDEKLILQLVPDREVAYHVGSFNYTKLAKQITGSYLTPNHFTIGIEMCVNNGADFDQTINNSYALISELWVIHGQLPLYRHADITGKQCPKIPTPDGLNLMDGAEWEAFKQNAFEFHKSKFVKS